MNTTSNAPTANDPCYVCKLPVPMLKDRIYVAWDGKSENLNIANHKACAERQYKLNVMRAAGFMECVSCGNETLILTAEERGGKCRKCFKAAS